uniref:E3 ubiquitin-protein transferase MAEA n=2 Tax=Meloidogyne TaxID=189290 RepID=A0A914KP22_MELIC
MSGKSLTTFNELNCLEYGTLKIPYELLNKKFRCTQRVIDQCIFHFQKEFELLEQKLKGRTQPICLNEVSNNISKLNKLITQFKDDVSQKLTEEIESGEVLNKQVEMLTQAGSSDSTVRKSFYDQRLNRFIVEHLLRTGYFETAQMLADYVGLDIQAQKSVYLVARQSNEGYDSDVCSSLLGCRTDFNPLFSTQFLELSNDPRSTGLVEESLRNKDLTLCLNWVRDNRSRLHRIGSRLETEVRIQHCVELVKSGRTADSLKYVQSFFGNKSDLHGVHWMANTNLLHLMGLIALGKDSSRSEHQPLLSDERYSTLIQLFRLENDRIYKFCTQSPFSACLQAGIAVHKTPQCKKDSNSRCIVCSSVFELSEGLPYTHLSNSRLFCAISGELFDCEDNRPMMLPNGHVYGEKSMRKLAKNNEFVCPRTLTVYSLDDIQRVFLF